MRTKCSSIWVPATVLADRPAKIASEASPDEEVTIANDITALMSSAKQELIMISPYFVPGKDGVAMMRKLVGRGVHIRILTNSLASTDSPLVDIGYARYRVRAAQARRRSARDAPETGQKRRALSSLPQLQRQPARQGAGDRSENRIHRIAEHGRAVHRINSELGLVISSAEIARQVTSLLDDISTDGSYKLQLVDRSDRIEWSSGEPGRHEDLAHRPGNHLSAAALAEDPGAVRAGRISLISAEGRRPAEALTKRSAEYSSTP